MSPKYICFFLSFLLVSFSLKGTPLPHLQADAAILIEPKTNTVLYAKNAHLKFYPASTTKILTSLILLEDLPLNTLITKTQESTLNVPSDSSQIGIKIGESYTALEGLYAIMLASDNFVSYDMAIKDASSINSFVKKMNERAKRAGALSSHFVNPHGYHDPQHYTTPFDLSQIARAAFNHSKFTEISGTASHIFKIQDTGRTISITHTASLLDQKSPLYNPFVIGAKTGFHTPAKRTLISKASYNNIDLIGVIMRADQPIQFEDMNTLLTYGMENYSLIQNASSPNMLINHSYSPWAKPYIDLALQQGLTIDRTKNYTNTLSKREFVNLLKSGVSLAHGTLLDAYIDYNGASIYQENLPISYEELSHFIDLLLNDLSLSSTYVPVITNLSSHSILPNPYHETIKTMLIKDILSLSHPSFPSDHLISYEEAIGIICKLIPILDMYTSTHLIGISHGSAS